MSYISDKYLLTKMKDFRMTNRIQAGQEIIL